MSVLEYVALQQLGRRWTHEQRAWLQCPLSLPLVLCVVVAGRLAVLLWPCDEGDVMRSVRGMRMRRRMRRVTRTVVRRGGRGQRGRAARRFVIDAHLLLLLLLLLRLLCCVCTIRHGLLVLLSFCFCSRRHCLSMAAQYNRFVKLNAISFCCKETSSRSSASSMPM